MDGDIFVVPYFPNSVKQIIATGSNHYIGIVNESTILKYPHFKGPSPALHAESLILQRLGKHPRIIEFKGSHDGGLLLEYAPHGSLEGYLRATQLGIEQRLQITKEVA